MLLMHFSPTDPRCHGNEIFTDKMAYNSACVKDFRDIFALIVDFRRCAVECCQLHFFPIDTRCHGNKIWDKMGYKSACVKNFREIFALIVDFRDAPLNAENCIFTQPIHVAMTAKIETK